MIAKRTFNLITVRGGCCDGKNKRNRGSLFVDVNKIFGGTGKSGIKSQGDGVKNRGFAAAGRTKDAKKSCGSQTVKINHLFFAITVNSP